MKTWALWISLLLLLGVAAGCGGGDSNNPNVKAPTIESITPVDRAEDIDTTTKIWIIFSESMDQKSVEESFVLQAGTGTVAGSFAWDDANMVFSPAANLLQGESYTVVVGTGAKDLDGNPLAEEFRSSFTTAFTVDIVEIVPADGAGQVAVDVPIKVTFRGAMEPATVEAAFSLAGPAADLSGVFSWQTDNKVMTFDPDLDLEVACQYTVKIGTGASDADGNFLLTEFVSTFSTEAPRPDVSGPVVDAMPTWRWTATGAVTAYRYQLDAEDGSWTEVAATVTEFTPQAALTDGEHTLYVQAAYSEGNWSPSGSWTVIVGTVFEGDLVVTSAADIQGFKYLKISGSLKVEGSTSLTSLAGLESLLVVGGDLQIQYNTVLASVAGLDNLRVVHGSVSFSGNDSLANLYGLEALEKIGGGLSFSMSKLTSMEGLSGLIEIGGNLFVSQSTKLEKFTGLQRLSVIKGNLSINRNNMIDCTGLSNLETIGGDLEVFRSSLETFSGLETLESIGGSLTIDGSSVGSMQGLGNLQKIGGDLKFADASGSVNLAGLDKLTTIGRSLLLSYTRAPTSLGGLEGLVSIGDQFVASNASLADAGNLTNLVSVGGRMNFADNAQLKTMGNYPSLTSIGGDLAIIHNGLTSLGDFSALTKLGGNLSVGGNFTLPNCQAEKLAAQLLAAGWTGTSTIGDNGPGTCP